MQCSNIAVLLVRVDDIVYVVVITLHAQTRTPYSSSPLESGDIWSKSLAPIVVIDKYSVIKPSFMSGRRLIRGDDNLLCELRNCFILLAFFCKRCDNSTFKILHNLIFYLFAQIGVRAVRAWFARSFVQF